MSLPPGFLDELRTRTSLAQVAGRKITWDSRKSNPGKGDYWAPCPFHQEKTASFHLDDRKGFYYCFGCHAKGDALSFVRETENVGFMEAVEILAREAGLTMPARDPKAQEKADKRSQLVDVMEQAVQFYRLQLNTTAGSAARDYLKTRVLSEATQLQFEIGFAPDSRTSLFSHLAGKGVAPDLIVEAGLAIKPDDGGAPFDRFRGRLMFPIRDAQGRAIAFGGRAMSPNARAKYLNSPETPLFDKGRSLYNFAPAREASGKSGALVVAEGYMDVIALVQAGFGHAVAPLGTAITEDQLRLLWRIADEPVIALDGDKAGLRAAMRLIDLALPMIEPGKSLRFCILPEGMDPDDLIKSDGAQAMQALLENARPMIELLWRREIEGKIFDSPERRAALDASLRRAIGTIQDMSIRNHYTAAIKELRKELFAPARKNQTDFRPNARPAFGSAKRGKGRFQPPPVPTEGTRASLLAKSDSATDQMREGIILAICIRYPELVSQFESQLEKLTIGRTDYSRLRDAVLELAPDCVAAPGKLHQQIGEKLGPEVVENLFLLRHVQIAPLIRNPADPQTAIKALAEELAKHSADRGVMNEVTEAMEDITGEADEGLTWRLQQAAEARSRAARATLPEGGSDAEDRAGMSNFLQNLIDDEAWRKKKK